MFKSKLLQLKKFTLRPVNEPIHGKTPPLHGEFGGLRLGVAN